MTDSAVKYERGDDGIVVLTLDDPTASANTMNELYKDSMHAAIDRLYAEKDDVTGVVITSAKKTFFAGGNLKGMLAATPDDAQAVFEMCEGIKADLRRLETLRQAGRGRDQRRRARRRPRDHAGLPPPHRGRRPEGRARPARGHPRPAARRRRRHPHRADVRHPVRADGRPAPGHPLQAGGRQGEGPRRRARRRAATTSCPAAKKWIKANQDDPQAASNPWDRDGYKIPGGSPSSPGAGGVPAGVPGDAAQADQGRASTRHRARSWPRPSRARRSTSTPPAGSSRATSPQLIIGSNSKNMIQAFFFDLSGDQLRAAASRGRAEVHRHQGRRPRRRDDGRRHRLLLRPRRHGGRAQGRRAGVGRQGQGLQREDPDQGRRARQDGREEEGRDPRPDHRDHRGRRLQGLRPGDRGGLRGPVAQGARCSARSRTS